MKKIFFVLLLLFGSLFATTEKKVPTVVSVSWIKENLNNPNLVIVDLREKSEFDKGHIKDTVNMPGLESLFEKDNWMMPKLIINKIDGEIKASNEVINYEDKTFEGAKFSIKIPLV